MVKRKTKRNRNIIIFISQEGEREEIFLKYLQELFDPEMKITLKFSQETGGNSNKILLRAFRNIYYNKVYAWFDEDDALDNEHKKMLKKYWGVKFPSTIKDSELQSYNNKMKKPIIIVSTPYSVEGILIRLFEKNLPSLIEPVNSKVDFEENKKRMKSSVKGFMGNLTDYEYYKNNLTKEKVLEKAQEIEELRLLLTIFE